MPRSAHLDAPSGRHHDAFVRTTLTLDDDVFRLVEEEAHRSRRPLKQVVNDALRRGLSPGLAKRRPERVRIAVHEGGPLPGLDPGALNRLADELEEASMRPPRRARR
jgi:hypothetical protein